MNPPDDLVELGRIHEPYGLKGWVNVFPDTEDPTVLLKANSWWLSRLRVQGIGSSAVRKTRIEHDDLEFESFKVLAVKSHAGHLVAHLEGIEHRELAQTLKGRRIYVSRSRFPKAQDDEYYWIDLIGCKVNSTQGNDLGTVKEVIDHGAHAILVVTRDDRKDDLLIPFVETYIPEVKLAERVILADWEDDYL